MIARVFPRRTMATPTDPLAFAPPHAYPGLVRPHVDEIHISAAFSWDLREAERLARAWEPYGRVTIGGPATGTRGEAFTPGLYLAPGYVITSRGCPGHCPWCTVWQREGPLRELPITAGHRLQDSNLLACSETHIRKVFAMLAAQPRRAHFVGGLEAARLRPWHIELLQALRPKQMFFAYNGPKDLEPLHNAGTLLHQAGFSIRSRVLRCYVLIGYPGDTLTHADTRLRQTIQAGFWPFAMLYRDQTGHRAPEWIPFTRSWMRPALIARNMGCVPEETPCDQQDLPYNS